jgi:hypothetical protein
MVELATIDPSLAPLRALTSNQRRDAFTVVFGPI